MSVEDYYISYLPMAHVMERVAFNCCLAFEVKIGLYSGNPKLLTEDMKILRPTIFMSVPRVFNKIY
jgi:long-chain acyl-CoA synthetase